MNNSLVLATDLDGTFLEGNLNTRDYFYSKLKMLQDRVTLIYTTGRGIEAVQYICEDYNLPKATIVLADHGTHIVDGGDWGVIPHLQNPIIEQWKNGHQEIKNLLANEPGITPQPFYAPYRAPYYYIPELLQQSTINKITIAGYDVLLSCNAYFDVLPKDVNKGTSLLKTLNYLNISHDRVITCGDSLNDLPLFQTGLKSIVVGNAEEKLLTVCQNLPNVYVATSAGIEGIMEGLSHLNVMTFDDFQ